MTKTIKTAILALIIVSATLMGGCLNDTAKEDVTLERMVQLEAILTDPEISEEEKIAAYTLVHEAITGEKVELDTEADVAPTLIVPEYRVRYTLSDSGAELLDGVGYFTVRFGGILVIDNTTVSGFKNIGIDKIEIVEIFVNNESVAKFKPILDEGKKIETTQVGDWIVRIEVTFTDGTTMTVRDAKFNGMKDLSDHPDYKKSEITVTGSGPFDARYIEVPEGQMTRAEAKELCDELGIVWGDERDS